MEKQISLWSENVLQFIKKKKKGPDSTHDFKTVKIYKSHHYL